MNVRIVWSVAIVGLVSALGTTAFAQNQNPPAPPSNAPKITLVEGQPITVDFGDGRVAVVKRQSVEAPEMLTLPFQVFDSLCSDSRGQQCKYKTGFRSVFFFLAWKTNPDASKIDQPVLRKQSEGNTTEERFRRFEQNQQLFGADKTVLPKMAEGMPMPQIECDDFSWLPHGAKEAPEQVFARRWDGEMMLANSETGVNENRLFMTVLNADWRKSGPRTLELKSYSGLTTAFGQFLPVLMLGDVVTATIVDQKAGLCSAELKPGSIQEIGAKLQMIEATRPALNVGASVVIAGTDESSKSALKGIRSIAGSITSLLENIKSTPGSSVE